jgi:cell wall-associated NlpC family hydrolase
MPDAGRGSTQSTVAINVVPKGFVPAVAKNNTLHANIVDFAKTLIGTPYHFGSTAPEIGFDCSGFITYVFTHFGVDVPRSSIDFTNHGTPIPLDHARPSDLILFTGTNSKQRNVGHIGIIVANDASGISFIHSSSGKENAVVITCLKDYYMGRFIKVVRVIN